jgi:hypothetical protein
MCDMSSRLRAIGLVRAISFLVIGLAGLWWGGGWLLSIVVPVQPVPINIRWNAEVDDKRRVDLERQFHLIDGQHAEGTTWSYLLTDPSSETIRTIVEHPNVDDTAHVDRVEFRPALVFDRTRRVVLGVAMVGLAAMAVDLGLRITPSVAGWAFRAVAMVVALCMFMFTWFFRFNDAGGGFAGLSDDHFFYVVRGWQILFGELPVRDFVDHGAPLYYYVAAAVQFLFGRGTLSELAFSVTMIALGAAVTFWLAARASGSIAAGLLGAAFHVLSGPRFYNYPKVLVYAALIPVLWACADRWGRRPFVWLAVITTVGFLFRHDHGVFVAIAVVSLLLFLVDVPWREKGRDALVYGALVLVLAAPYLLFVQLNGGVFQYFRTAGSWAEEERNRTPVQWPGLFDNPGGISETARAGTPLVRAVAVVRDNAIAWLYYLEIALPFFALAILAVSRDGFRPDWPRAVPKIGVVAVLGLVLDAGFLRSPLGARLPDPSVPLSILIAWLAVALPRLLAFSSSWRDSLRPWIMPLRAVLSVTALVFAFVLASIFSSRLDERLDDAYLLEGADQAIQRAQIVSRTLSREWNPSAWSDGAERSELMNLALYLNTCTSPTDRVFVQPYIPQVLALSRRAFAGGHADLRPGFFGTDEDQALVLRRLRSQSVPVALLGAGQDLANFRKWFSSLTAYFDLAYQVAGTHTFDDRLGITLLVKSDAHLKGRFEPLDWPCLVDRRTGADD